MTLRFRTLPLHEKEKKGSTAMIKIQTVSVHVDDQAKAQKFYTEVLGFQTALDMPVGAYRFLTVVSPQHPDGTQLLLGPDDNPIAKAYQQGLKAAGLPCMIFGVDDIQAAYQRMTAAGATFTQPPTPMGPVTVAVVDDTCGNLVQLAQYMG
jgi:predicted enzyme related to lactoylglutathione lyase